MFYRSDAIDQVRHFKLHATWSSFGYELETGPKPCEIQTTFGSYATDYSIRDGIFNYWRRFEYKEKVIPAERFSDYSDFLKAIVQNDQTKFVFKK